MSDKPTYVRTGKVIDDIRAIAREHGYAIAVHGERGDRRKFLLRHAALHPPLFDPAADLAGL